MIRQLTETCWETSGDRDGWHHPDEELAREDAVARLSELPDGSPVPSVTEMPGPCWVADCDHPGCERVLGEDGMVYFHAPDQATLRALGVTYDWMFPAGGLAVCGEHDRPEPEDRAVGCQHDEQWCCDLCWPERKTAVTGLTR
jgi:hypothetical protein